MHLTTDTLRSLVSIVRVLVVGVLFSCTWDKSQEDCITEKVMVVFCYPNYCIDSVWFVECKGNFKLTWGFLQKGGRLYLLIDEHVNHSDLIKINTFKEEWLDTIFYRSTYNIRQDTDLPAFIEVFSNSDTVLYSASFRGGLIAMNLSAGLGALWFERLLHVDSTLLKSAIKVSLNMTNYKDTIVPVYIVPRDYFLYAQYGYESSSFMEQCQSSDGEEKFVFNVAVKAIKNDKSQEIYLLRYYIYPVGSVIELPCF